MENTKLSSSKYMFKLYKYQMEENAIRLKGLNERLDLTPLFFGEKIYIFGRAEGRELECESNRFY